MQIKRLNAMPTVAEPDTIYLINKNGALQIIVTGTESSTVLAIEKVLQPLKVFAETKNLASGASTTYDVMFRLQSVLGVLDDYDLQTIQADVLVQDKDVNSPTYNFYINSEASLVVGIVDTGIVKIVNHTNITQSIRVCITVNPKEIV